MTATRLIELAERVEQASGPDRELDEAILKACWVTDGKRTDLGPRFTASLDAAMSLVLEGYAWNVNVFISRGPTASVYDRNAVGADGDAATPALALTAACLRALAQGEK